MPHIQQIVPISAPKEEPYGKPHPYRSRQGDWTIVFRDPREFHMGAEGWRAQLWSAGRNVSRKHDRMLDLAGSKGFRFEAGFRPWAADATTLALITWDPTDPVHLYDPSERSVSRLPTGASFPYSVQWSPTLDRLLIPFEDRGSLFDARGTPQGTARWNPVPGESIYTDWTRWGMFFLIARASTRARTRLSFSMVRPARLPRNSIWIRSMSFPMTPTLTGNFSGGLLARREERDWGGRIAAGHWHGVRFDLGTDTLRLATYRPTSMPYRAGGHLLCKVESRWVAVTLAA